MRPPRYLGWITDCTGYSWPVGGANELSTSSYAEKWFDLYSSWYIVHVQCKVHETEQESNITFMIFVFKNITLNYKTEWVYLDLVKETFGELEIKVSCLLILLSSFIFSWRRHNLDCVKIVHHSIGCECICLCSKISNIVMVRPQKLCKAAVDDIYLIWFGVMTWTTYTSYFFIVIGAGSVCAFYFIKLNQYFVNSEIILCFHQRIVSEQWYFLSQLMYPMLHFVLH